MEILLRLAVLLLVAGRFADSIAAALPDVRPACPRSCASDYYFPSSALDPASAKLDEFLRQWYSKHLRAMSEASLSCGVEGNATTYRFTWLRTFHHPIAVRVTNSTGGMTLVAVELSGAGGYAPSSVKNRVEKSLAPEQWAELLNAIEAAGFWSEAAKDPYPEGVDGAQWVVEGERNGKYHVVDRWSPKHGADRDLGTLFLKFAGLLPVSSEEIY